MKDNPFKGKISEQDVGCLNKKFGKRGVTREARELGLASQFTVEVVRLYLEKLPRKMSIILVSKISLVVSS